MQLKSISRSVGLVIVMAGVVPTIAHARNPIEQVVQTLPSNSKVLVVCQSFRHQHPECAEPVDGDWESFMPTFLKKLEWHKNRGENVGKQLDFDTWDQLEDNLTNEERESILDSARDRGMTHVLYYKALLRYMYNQSMGQYILSSIDWTLKLQSIESKTSQLFAGNVTDWNIFKMTPLPVSCLGTR